MSNPAPAIRAYLGGSFDPVHNSHIQMALHVHKCLVPVAEHQQRPLQVCLLPNARSPFKQHSTDPKHRLAMLTLATQGTPLHISELELWQPPPVYTIDSVRALRQRYPKDTLIFIIGMDSARSLAKWKDGLQLTNYVHLWVFDRIENYPDDVAPHLSDQSCTTLHHKLPIELQAHVTHLLSELTPPSPAVADLKITRLQATDSKTKGVDNNDMATHSTASKTYQPLKNSAKGRIYIDPHLITTVSSTQIRDQLCQSLSDEPYEPLQTEARLTTERNNLSKYLNPTVYQYIIAHQLYSAAQFR